MSDAIFEKVKRSKTLENGRMKSADVKVVGELGLEQFPDVMEVHLADFARRCLTYVKKA